MAAVPAAVAPAAAVARAEATVAGAAGVMAASRTAPAGARSRAAGGGTGPGARSPVWPRQASAPSSCSSWPGVSYAYATTAVPSDAAQAATQQQSTVYFSDGKTTAGTFGSTDRQVLTYSQISPYMRDAVVAAEDRGFYNEGGVSPTGIVRAAYEDVFNSGGSGGSLQGGSTITQAVRPQLLRQHRDPADRDPEDQGDLRRR